MSKVPNRFINADIKTYNQFKELLKISQLTIKDLHVYGTARQRQINTFVNHFRGMEDDEEWWANYKIKKVSEYYTIVISSTAVARFNKISHPALINNY